MGLKLKARADRGGTFYAVGTVAGRRIRQSLGTSDRQRAEEARAQLEARLWEASVYGTKAVATFEDAALSYLQDGGEARFVAPLLHHFKGRLLHDIKPKDVRDAGRRIYPKASGATLNRQVITPARAIINHAAEQDLCHPIKVKHFKTTKPRRQAVSADWIAAFRAEALGQGKRHLAALCRALFETGCRISELTRLTPGDLALERGLIDLGTTKNGQAYTAALSAGLVAELAELPTVRGKVFGYANKSSIYGVWRRVCDGAGIPYVPPHQAGRHSFATTLEAAGWSANAIAEAGRWESVRLVQETYVHAEGQGRAAAEALGSLIEDPPGTVVPLKRRRT